PSTCSILLLLLPFFLSLFPHPLRSTFFPYTTLFRSETVLRWKDFGLRQLDRNGIPRITPFRLRKHSSRRGWRVTVHSFGRNPFADRKSTRLNSSHEWISYAVFCLKKKNKTYIN